MRIIKKKTKYISIFVILMIGILILYGCGVKKASKPEKHSDVKFNEDEVAEVANNPLCETTLMTLDRLGYIGIRETLILKPGQYNYRFLKEEVVVKGQDGEDKTTEEDLFSIGLNVTDIGGNSFDTKNITLAFNNRERTGEFKALGGNTHFVLSDLIGKEPVKGAKYTVNASVDNGKVLLNDPKRIMEIKIRETGEDGSSKDYIIFFKLVVTKRANLNHGFVSQANDSSDPQESISDGQSIATIEQNTLSDLEDRAIESFSAMLDKQSVKIGLRGCMVKFSYEVLEKSIGEGGSESSQNSSFRILGDGNFDIVSIDDDKVNQSLPIMHWMRYRNNQIGTYFQGHRFVIPDEFRVKGSGDNEIEGNPGELVKDSLNLTPGRNILINEIKINLNREKIQRIYRIYLSVEEGV